jgi:hypothetical protein
MLMLMLILASDATDADAARADQWLFPLTFTTETKQGLSQIVIDKDPGSWLYSRDASTKILGSDCKP